MKRKDEIMKILTIGNSFAVNSCHYLPEICAEGKIPLTLGRANIGGCPLASHLSNAVQDIRRYGNIYDGDRTLREMLESEDWDYVTMQQASHDSWRIGTYHPYFERLRDFVHENAPGAEIVIHETWAYRADNERLRNEFMISQRQMFELLKENYLEIAGMAENRDGKSAMILPVGEAFRIMQELTGDKTGELTRNPDGPSHANALGELIGGLIWYALLGGGDYRSVSFVPEGVDAKYVPLAKEAVGSAIAMYKAF